jgi:hypothetical protein
MPLIKIIGFGQVPQVSIGTTRIWLFDKAYFTCIHWDGDDLDYFLVLVSLGLISAPHTSEKEWYGVL